MIMSFSFRQFTDQDYAKCVLEFPDCDEPLPTLMYSSQRIFKSALTAYRILIVSGKFRWQPEAPGLSADS